MYQRIIVSLAVFSTLLVSAHAATVDWAADNYNGVSLANGTAVPVGDLVEIGSFSFGASGSALSLDIQNAYGTGGTAGFNTVLGDFTPFGSTTIGYGGDPAGQWALKGSANTGFAGQQIVMMVFNASTTAAATQFGVFFESSASNSAWAFPADGVSFPTTVDLADLTVSGGTNTLNTGAYIPITGSGFGVGTSLENSGASNFDLAVIAVPEPGSTSLLVIGLGAMALRRRRRA